MNTPFNKSFCGKSPLNELTARQEANLPEALKTAIEAKSPTNYGSPLEQQDDKSYFDSITKLPGIKDRYKKYVKRKEEGYTDPEDGYIAPSPETIVTPERHAVSIEIGKGGKSGVKGAKASRSDLYKMKYKDFVKK